MNRGEAVGRRAAELPTRSPDRRAGDYWDQVSSGFAQQSRHSNRDKLPSMALVDAPAVLRLRQRRRWFCRDQPRRQEAFAVSRSCLAASPRCAEPLRLGIVRARTHSLLNLLRNSFDHLLKIVTKALKRCAPY